MDAVIKQRVRINPAHDYEKTALLTAKRAALDAYYEMNGYRDEHWQLLAQDLIDCYCSGDLTFEFYAK